MHMLADADRLAEFGMVDVRGHGFYHRTALQDGLCCFFGCLYYDLGSVSERNHGLRIFCTIRRGLMCGIMFFVARPSCTPSRSTKNTLHLISKSTTSVTYFDGTSTGASCTPISVADLIGDSPTYFLRSLCLPSLS